MIDWRSVFLEDVPPSYRSPVRYLKLFLFGQGYRLALNYRIGRTLLESPSIFRFMVPFLKRAQYRKWSCDVSFHASLGRRITFPHPTGIVIGKGAVVGDDPTIFQNTTIGSHGRRGDQKQYALIGDRVILYAGSKVLGGVRIGDDVVVGANAVVTRDLPSGVRAAGIPAKVL